MAHRLEDVVPQAVGQSLTGGEVVVAGLGRDREAVRQPDLDGADYQRR